jgi:hypothetical protein
VSHPPSYPAPGPWATPNALQLIPRPRRSLVWSLVSTLLCTVPTFVVVYLFVYVFGTFLDVLESTARDAATDPSQDGITRDQVTQVAVIAGLVVMGVHLALGVAALLLLRISETFASWHPLLQGLCGFALGLPLTLPVLVLIGQLA